MQLSHSLECAVDQTIYANPRLKAATLNSMESQQLLNKLRENPEKTLSELFTVHRTALRQVIAARLDRRLLDRVDPSDVLQETLIEASNRLREYLDNPKVPFKNWLSYLAEQNAVAAYRFHFATQKRSVNCEERIDDKDHASGLASLDYIVNEITDPQERVIRGESHDLLLNAMEKLSESDRGIIQRRYFQGESIPEIAAALGLTKEATSKRVFRAVRKLSQLLSE